MKKVGKYRLKNQLGKGAFSVVFQATDSETNTECAVKMCEKQQLTEQDMLGELENEIAVLKKIKSKYIANLKDVIQTGRYYYLVLDLCKGTLFDLIVAEKRLPEDRARKFFHQLLLGVYSLHQQGVMHRDIKPENILLTESGQLKLSDFGFACPVAKTGEARIQCGTRQYLAPEVFTLNFNTSEFDGFAVDVWSCGVVAYVMCCGRLPFADHDPDALVAKICAADVVFSGNYVSEECKATIRSILNPDYTRRPTIFQIMEMPWFKEGFSNELLEEINSELLRQRSIRIVPMPQQFNRHIPTALSASPMLVESHSYHHGSMGHTGSMGYDSGYNAAYADAHNLGQDGSGWRYGGMPVDSGYRADEQQQPARTSIPSAQHPPGRRKGPPCTSAA